MIDKNHGWNVSFRPSILGFVISLLLTLTLYRFVIEGHLNESLLKTCIFGLGAFQVLVQLFFFLHLGMESKPHWNTITFIFMVILTAVVIGGSVWIMNNLNYHLMPHG